VLNPNILRENVGGEAIEWAETRLSVRIEASKILLVLNDGAPADDCVLKENGPSYLVSDLLKCDGSRTTGNQSRSWYRCGNLGVWQGHQLGHHIKHKIRMHAVKAKDYFLLADRSATPAAVRAHESKALETNPALLHHALERSRPIGIV
jgi:hypothetical protein